MKILLSAFACNPRRGSELSTGWNWAAALAEMGHDVTVLTCAESRDDILSENPVNIDFRFLDSPASSLRRFSSALGMYETYLRWQDAALNHIHADGRKYDVAHHVTWGGLHLGSQLWKLPAPLVYGPVGGGQTAPAGYWRYFGREWPAEIVRTASDRTNAATERPLPADNPELCNNPGE